MPATLVAAPRHSYATIMEAKGHGQTHWLMLAPATKHRLQLLFGRFGLDLTNLRFSTRGAVDQGGLTFGDIIYLSTDFGRLGPQRQLGLLAHEITHSVQYRAMGWSAFLLRYLKEWKQSGGDPYLRAGDPKSEEVLRVPIHAIDPTSPKIYLDQIADRFLYAIEKGR